MENQRTDGRQLPRSLQAVLGAMKDKDRKLFGQYLQFEPFNSQQRLVDLYRLVLLYFFPDKKPPQKPWEAALAEAGIHASQLDKQLTYLHQKLDQFLGLKQIMAAPQRHPNQTLAGYNMHKVEFATLDKKWRQLDRKLQAEPLSVELMHTRINLEHEATKARLAAHVAMEGSYFAEAHRLIDVHYLLCKLKYCAAAVNEAQLLQLPFPASDVAQVQAFWDHITGELPPFGLAYKTILDLQLSPAQPLAAYEAAVAKLMAYQPAICREDNLDLFNYFLNLCYLRLDVGEPGFEALVTRLYEDLMRLNLLFDEVIPPRIYRNMVSLLCRKGRFAQCHAFIDDYQKMLPAEDQGNLPMFCRGLVHNYEGKYLEAAAIFREFIRSDPEDHLWAFESRNLLLKAHFQRYESLNHSEYDELYRLRDSFKMYVRRNTKLDSFHQQCYLNFIHYFSLLLRHLEEHGTRTFPEELRQTILAEKNITNKAWLMKVFLEKR